MPVCRICDLSVLASECYFWAILWVRHLLEDLVGFPVAQLVKNLPANAGDVRGSDPWVRKISWSRKWQPTPVFLPGEAHGQRSLVCYSPWGCKESDMTERLSNNKEDLVYSRHFIKAEMMTVVGVVMVLGVRVVL